MAPSGCGRPGEFKRRRRLARSTVACNTTVSVPSRVTLEGASLVLATHAQRQRAARGMIAGRQDGEPRISREFVEESVIRIGRVSFLRHCCSRRAAHFECSRPVGLGPRCVALLLPPVRARPELSCAAWPSRALLARPAQPQLPLRAPGICGSGSRWAAEDDQLLTSLPFDDDERECVICSGPSLAFASNREDACEL